jgi:hypothetical protein
VISYWRAWLKFWWCCFFHSKYDWKMNEQRDKVICRVCGLEYDVED